MMLRVSSEVDDETVNLESLVSGDAAGNNLPGSAPLLAFAEVALGDDAQAITTARDNVTEALGEAAMIDAAGIIANFQRMVRIADSTGIPLDPPVVMMTQDLRADLGLNEYASAANTPTLGWGQRLMGRMLAPFATFLLTRLFRRPHPD